MVKKLGLLGITLIAVIAAASMVWAGTTNMGAIAAPQPMVMPAAAPPACIGGNCAPPPPKVMPIKPKKLTTSIEVKMQYPQPAAPVCPPPMMCGPAGPPPDACGSSHVEVHCALAPIRILSAG